MSVILYECIDRNVLFSDFLLLIFLELQRIFLSVWIWLEHQWINFVLTEILYPVHEVGLNRRPGFYYCNRDGFFSMAVVRYRVWCNFSYFCNFGYWVFLAKLFDFIVKLSFLPVILFIFILFPLGLTIIFALYLLSLFARLLTGSFFWFSQHFLCNSYNMYPELFLLVAIVGAIIAFSTTKLKYDDNFFYASLVRAFGYERMSETLYFGSYQYRLLMRFHNTRRQLTAVIVAWRVICVGIIFGLCWFFHHFGLVYPIEVRTSMQGPSTAAAPSVPCGFNDYWFGAHFYHDSFTFGSRFFILFVLFLFFILARNELFNEPRLGRLEFLILYVLGGFFSMCLAASSSLLMFFLAAEGLVFSMYLLTAGGGRLSVFPLLNFEELTRLFIKFRAIEGAIKYSIFNVVSTGGILFGSLLLFIFSGGSVYFTSISFMVAEFSDNLNNFSWSSALVLGGLFTGMFFFIYSIIV